MLNKILPMTGVEPRTSGIESDCSTNSVTSFGENLKLWQNYSLAIFSFWQKNNATGKFYVFKH